MSSDLVTVPITDTSYHSTYSDTLPKFIQEQIKLSMMLSFQSVAPSDRESFVSSTPSLKVAVGSSPEFPITTPRVFLSRRAWER